MEESILTSVKKIIGMTEDYDVFDADMIMHINTVFMILRQLGVGPADGFVIYSKDDVWSDFIPADDIRFEGVKTYVALKTRLVFDPPSSSIVKACIDENIKELESRLNWEADY